MYARVTNFKIDPSRLSELSAKIKEMGPRAKALPGMIDAYAAWRADGQGVVVALYESKEAADRSWQAFRDDPDWVKAKAASEKDGTLVQRVESVYMKGTDYSPIK